jgi:hypothetical protein
MEHLPRSAARYQAVPVDHARAKEWLQQPDLVSLVRTTELISAINAGLGVLLGQAATSRTLRPGDEALLIGLSFSVLLAWAEGKIPPVEEDWRCILLTVEGHSESSTPPTLEASVVEEVNTSPTLPSLDPA